MEDHCLFFICSFILGSTGFLLVPSGAHENGKAANTPLIIICWHDMPLQLIRKDALDERHHFAIPRWPTMSQARDHLVTVSLEAELVSMTMTDLRSFIIPCKITITSLDCPRAPDLSWNSTKTENPLGSVQESAAPRGIRLEADESPLELHLMLI